MKLMLWHYILKVKKKTTKHARKRRVTMERRYIIYNFPYFYNNLLGMPDTSL